MTEDQAPTIASNFSGQLVDLEAKVVALKRDLHRANLRNASVSAQLKMVENQRDSWLPWWFRQSLFKFLRRHFPLTQRFLKQYVLKDYLSAETLQQIAEAHRDDQKRAKEWNRQHQRNAKGRPRV